MFPSASQCKFRRQSEDPSCPNERYLLYREWAHPRSIYKKQPLDLIRWGVVGSTPGGGTQGVTPTASECDSTHQDSCQWRELTQSAELRWPGFLLRLNYVGMINWIITHLQYHPPPGRWPVICGSKLQFSNHMVDLPAWPASTLSHLISTNSLEAHHEPLHWHKLSGIVLGSHCE